MNVWDMVIGLGVALLVTAAVVSCVRRRKSGKGCCGDCARCGGCTKE